MIPPAMRALAVVPAYNEAATVGDVVRLLRAHQPHFDVLVIDDGSTDATREIAEAAGARTIRHPFNLGIGGAVQTGFSYALENDYELMVQVDGDGQHDPAEIRTLVAAMNGDDVVCGSRFLAAGNYVAPRSRRAGIRVFSWVLSRLVGQRVTDPTSGFRLYNQRAIALFAR